MRGKTEFWGISGNSWGTGVGHVDDSWSSQWESKRAELSRSDWMGTQARARSLSIWPPVLPRPRVMAECDRQEECRGLG